MELKMKTGLTKIHFAIIAMTLAFCADLFCDEFGKRLTKEFETDDRTFTREVKLYSITYYDKNENPIHTKYEDSDAWFAYDTSGNCIWSKDNLKGEFEEWMQYNEKSQLIYRKLKSEYDGYISEEWYEYDYEGNVIHTTTKEYNLDGDLLKEYESWCENTYDESGNLIWVENDRGFTKHYEYEYDEDVNLVSMTLLGVTSVYDRNGKVIREKGAHLEIVYEYLDGDLIYENWGGTNECFYEYEYDKNNYYRIKVKREYEAW